MKNWTQTRWILMAVALMAPALGLAQFSTGGETPSRPAWSTFKLDPKKRITLSFRNANVDMVIDVISRASGITIVKDPTLKDPITVASPKAVSLDEAFQILSAALSVRNYEIRKDGNILVIAARRQNQGRDGGGGSGFGGMTPEQIQQLMGGGQNNNPNELKVYRVKYANASEVARVVNEVFIQQQQQNNPMQFFQQMQQGGRNQGRGGGGGGRGGWGGFGNTGQQPTVRASSDDFSNTVIVNAPRNQQRDVENLIKEIDQQTEQPQKAQVYKLEFAIAQDLAAVVQNVLTSNAPTGRGGSGQQNVPLSQRFQQAARFGSMQAAFGTVVADSRTNSLIVTATDENQALVANVIKELDQEITLENTTFVFPLSNARADQVGNLLNQAFGGRTTAGGNRNQGTLNNRNQAANRNRNTGGGGGGGGLGGNTGRDVPDPTSLPLEFDDPDAVDGQLYTQVRIGAQGGFGGQGFGGFGGQNRQNQGTTGLARGADGRLVNVRDLSGQVTIISDPNTNSLIVVTAPDNVELIKQILDQLDRIPEQVMIETMIVEATLDKSMKLGVEWNFVQAKAFGSTGVTGNAGQGFGLQNTVPALEGFRYTLNGGNLSAFVNALQKDDRFQVLSTPRIFTSNNVEAEINISQSVPYVLSTREDANGNLTFNYAFQDVGIVLTVTPQITSNGYVTLDVSQTANDLQGFTSFNAPIVNQRQAQTTVSVMDGETVILGGIMRSTVSSKVKKLPLLGDIPILGELFKTTDRQNVKTELLVFLTPRVVRNPAEAAKLREEQENRLSPGVRKVVDNERPKPAATVGKGKKGNQIGPAPSPAKKKTSKIGG